MAWIKGHKHTEETKEKMRRNNWSKRGYPPSMLGKHQSKEMKRKMREAHKRGCFDYSKTADKIRGRKRLDMIGENNPAKRPEVRDKISKAGKGRKNPAARNNPQIFKKGHIPWIKGKHHTERAKLLNSLHNLGKIGIRGEKNHFWKGGISYEPYGKEFNKRLKEQIRKRDNYICQECKQLEKQLGYRLIVHHIDYNKKNNNPENLISLCKSCHSQTNFNREDWINYFRKGGMT